MLCPPHDAVHTLTSRPRQDRFGGHQRREPASRHRQSSGCAVIWARQGCSAQRLSAARQRERKEEKEDIAQMRSRPRLIPMKFKARQIPRQMRSVQTLLQSGVQSGVQCC